MPTDQTIADPLRHQAEDLAHGTRLTVAEAAVLICDRDGLDDRDTEALLGTSTVDTITDGQIGELLGISNSRVDRLRSSIREKRRELEAGREEIEATLEVLGGETGG